MAIADARRGLPVLAADFGAERAFVRVSHFAECVIFWEPEQLPSAWFCLCRAAVLGLRMEVASAMSEPVLKLDERDGIAIVTLNRPEKLNALNRELRAEFCRVMQDLRARPEITAVIITGAGRAFCAGLDLKELGSSDSGIRESGNVTFISVVEAMEVPVIAAVNGFAVTGGFELAMACDMIIASEDAQFADTHARVGVMPGGGMSVRLPLAVGIRKAKELSLTGNYLDAHEAERIGLINRVVPKGEVLNAAIELARQIQGTNQEVVRQMKRLIDLNSQSTAGEGLRREQEFFRAFNAEAKVRGFEARRDQVMERGRAQSRR
jgi:enoyl-CoA hydratase